MVLSGSDAYISPTTVAMTGQCRKSFLLTLTDVNDNPMPAGTTIATASDYVYYSPYSSSIPPTATPTLATVSIDAGTPVVCTSQKGGTTFVLTVAADCTAGTPIAYPAGVVDVVVTTPTHSVITSTTITVN
jgi:hypothetical protein